MITVDKLSLQLSGLSEAEGRKLARLLAEDLAIATLPAGCSADTDSVQVNIAPVPGIPVKKLSELIVADLLRQLDRTP
jgi:hypothetical protein